MHTNKKKPKAFGFISVHSCSFVALMFCSFAHTEPLPIHKVGKLGKGQILVSGGEAMRQPSEKRPPSLTEEDGVGAPDPQHDFPGALPAVLRQTLLQALVILPDS